jgi:PAS domain S-box-containing protein
MEGIDQRTTAAAQLERFHALFTSSPNFAAVLAGPEHRFLATNPAYQRLIGNKHVIGLTVRKALPETIEQGFVGLLDNVFTTGQAYVGRDVPLVVLRERDGKPEERRLDFVYQPVRDAEGVVVAIFVEGTDTTERHAASDELRRSDAWNRQILDAATDHAILTLDLKGVVTRWNAGAERTLGWTESEMLGSSADRIFTVDDRAAGSLANEMRTADETGRGSGEGWRLRKSGERFWASGETTPIRDSDGLTTGYVKVLRDRTREHEAAEALRRAGEMLGRAQAAGGVGTFSIEVDGGTLTTTAEFCRIYGVEISETVPAATIEGLVIDEDRERSSTAGTRAAGDVDLVTEYRIRRASDGETRWIARRAEFERDGAGRRIRLVGVVQDVTDQREAARALEESEVKFRAFTEAVPNQVWSATKAGALDWVNRRTSDYAGKDESLLLRSGWEKIVHADDLPAAARAWEHALATGETYEIEFRLRDARGSFRWHLARAVPMRDQAGAITRWIGTNTDIEDRKAASDELEQLNATLEERVERATRDRDRAWKNSQDLQAVVDRQGIFLAVNDAWRTVLGHESCDVIGHSHLEFLCPDDHAASLQALAIASADELAPYENRYRHAEGGYRWISWVAAPEGDLIYASGRHVTADKEAAIALEAAQEQLRQAQKMEAVGQLTGGVAHDFNNLLTVIRGSAELLNRDDLAPERRSRYVAAITETAERAARLTGQLLAFARRQSLTPEVFDVGDSLQKVADMIRTLTGSRVVLSLTLPETVCHVLADRSQFDTAIVNMAINARDAMAGEGALEIGVGSVSGIPSIRSHAPVAGDFVAVTIRDSGSGIDASDLQRIFEPFYTTKGVGAGTGLGLSQVIGFAKQSGGDIRVDSELGVGTTFTLYLPRAGAEPLVDGELLEDEASMSGAGVCVLVVEDNEPVGQFATQALRELGYDSVLATDALAALAELKSNCSRFHVVFSDVVMPGMDGLELAARIRIEYPDVPVILTSGYSHVLAQNGTHGFELLHKPYSIEQLSRVLRKAVTWGSRGSRLEAPAP